MKICSRNSSRIAATAVLLSVALLIPSAHAELPSEVLAVRPLERIATRFAALAGIPIAELIAEIRQKVQITMVPTPQFEPAATTRDCGAYNEKNGTAQISQDCWQITLSPSNREGFLLHEALGAAGYDDHYYKWSSLVASVNFFKNLSPSLRDSAESILSPNEKGSLHGGGGGSATGVKGGGDAYAFIFKLTLLKSTALLFANGQITEAEAVKLVYILLDLKITTTPLRVGFLFTKAGDTMETLVERAYVNTLEAEITHWFWAGGSTTDLGPRYLLNIRAVLNELGAD